MILNKFLAAACGDEGHSGHFTFFNATIFFDTILVLKAVYTTQNENFVTLNNIYANKSKLVILVAIDFIQKHIIVDSKKTYFFDIV